MDVDAALEEIKDGVVDLVKNAMNAFFDEAKEDLENLLEDSKEDLKRYAQMLSKGELTKGEFEFLLGAKVTNAKMLALSSKGIAKTRIKRLKTSITDLVLKVVFAAI
jgi:hypothetical protein